MMQSTAGIQLLPSMRRFQRLMQLERLEQQQLPSVLKKDPLERLVMQLQIAIQFP